MFILLIIILVIVLLMLPFFIASCLLLVKISDQMGDLYAALQVQKSNIGRLTNWVGGVPEEKQQDQS